MIHPHSFLLYAAIAIAALTPCNAFWILSHSALVSQRLDPIINGNNVSAHAHAFIGSAAILGDAQDTACTTSVVKDDRSRYWAPQLYYYGAATRTFDAVPLSFVNTYYLNRGNAPIKAFPLGFRMIAGNSMSFDAPLNDTTAAKAISFVCLNYSGGSAQTTTIPAGPCPDGLRTQIVFPSCWNGKDLDSTSHQTHVVYPLGANPDNGDCPASHPVRFMTLFYEFVYDVKQLRSGGDNGTLVLANGDATGYSFHADFISGWKVDTLQAAADQCTTNLFGDVEKCAPFAVSIDRTAKCTARPVNAAENVMVARAATLPGCNPVRNGKYKGEGGGAAGCAAVTTSASAPTPQTTKKNKKHKHKKTKKMKHKKNKKKHHNNRAVF